MYQDSAHVRWKQHVVERRVASLNNVILRQMDVMRDMSQMSRWRKHQRHATLPTKLAVGTL